jgi:hypothetical protein
VIYGRRSPSRVVSCFVLGLFLRTSGGGILAPNRRVWGDSDLSAV